MGEYCLFFTELEWVFLIPKLLIFGLGSNFGMKELVSDCVENILWTNGGFPLRYGLSFLFPDPDLDL